MGNKIQKFTVRQQMLTNNYEIYRYRDSYLNNVALHHHDFYEVYLFLNGNVNYTIESRNYHLLPGDIIKQLKCLFTFQLQTCIRFIN